MLDDTDRRILRHLQADPSIPLPELADRCGLTTGRTNRRIEKLRETGILKGQEAIINWFALGFEIAVSLRCTLDKTLPHAFDEFLAAARDVPEVIEIQTFLGQVDVRLHIVARDLPHWQRLYRERVLTLPHIAELESLLTVATLKRDEVLPL